MKPKTTMLALAIAGAVGSAAMAQDPPPAAPAEVLAPTPDAPAGWTPLSRSSARVYLINMSTIRKMGDVTAVPVARTRLSREDPNDYSYTIEETELNCTANQSRATTSVEYDSSDAETDRYEDPSAWAPIEPDTLDDFLKTIVCEGNVLNSRSWPTIRAFIEAGQPAASAP